MALVMLPCDLPWWPVIQRHLTQLALARTPQELTDGMQKIHNMCNIGLDPDEEKPEEVLFANLQAFMEKDLSAEEQSFLLGSTVPSMVQRALQLKQLKPASGLRFSLQQQADKVELDRRFVASLLAHSFFSTFPKRTHKTHPTLQDSNFTNFFLHLDKAPQKAKLRSILAYFDRMDAPDAPSGTIAFTRQVMTGKEWLTVDDWLELETPLTAVSVRHEGRLDRADADALRVCFASSHLGGDVLAQGASQECLQFCTAPELLTLLPWVEALEDNEVLLVDGVLQVARVVDPRHRADFEPTARSTLLRVCCMDAEDYRKLPLGQLEEDNVLRELNKALLGFRLHAPSAAPPPRRLSPIGESCGSTPPENRKESLRQRFIVLGSSGERLPVSRRPGPRPASTGSHYSSCRSTSASTTTEDFVSARASLEGGGDDGDDDEEEDDDDDVLLDTPERRRTFAARLRDALRLAREAEGSEDSSSYAVGISVAGSGVGDADGGCRVRRGGSGGFVLREGNDDDEDRLQELSSECSSDLEELCSRYSRWLEDLEGRELDARDVAVVRFAGSLLKRTLSDSFAGKALGPQEQVRVVARSLSLELARRKHRLAHLLQERHAPQALSVVTGNWGCGAARRGDPQLKMVLQWLAASAAGAATLVYYTCGHPHLLKLDTVVRVLLDRRWSVGELAGATLRHARATLEDPAPLEPCWLFDALIGVQARD